MLHFVGTIVLAAALLVPVGDYEREITGKARVIDGDTIEVEGERIRFSGIDAPELEQFCYRADGRAWPCGILAMVSLRLLIAGEPVRCFVHGRGKYGRSLATCHIWERSNLNADMVRKGWAVAYRDYSTHYVAVERGARSKSRGIWGSDFEMPWDWRRKHYQEPEREQPA